MVSPGAIPSGSTSNDDSTSLGVAIEVAGADIAAALVNFARSENASQSCWARLRRCSRWSEMTRGSVTDRAIRRIGIDVHIISPEEAPPHSFPKTPPRGHLASIPPARRKAGWLLGTIGMSLLVLALSPFRSTLGLPGAAVLVARRRTRHHRRRCTTGRAVVIAFALGEFFFTHPYHSFRMSVSAEITAMIVFAAVAAIVSVLVDRLARRGLQVARSRAESEALARLAGGSVLSTAEPLPDLVAELRRTFDLDSVAVLAPDGDRWRTIAVAGNAPPEQPEGAAFAAPLSEGTVLVLTGTMLDADDTRLLRAFVAPGYALRRSGRSSSHAPRPRPSSQKPTHYARRLHADLTTCARRSHIAATGD